MARTTYTPRSRSASEDKITEQIFIRERIPSLFIKIHVFALNTGVCWLCLVRVLVDRGMNPQSCAAGQRAVLEAVFLSKFAAGPGDAWFPT